MKVARGQGMYGTRRLAVERARCKHKVRATRAMCARGLRVVRARIAHRARAVRAACTCSARSVHVQCAQRARAVRAVCACSARLVCVHSRRADARSNYRWLTVVSYLELKLAHGLV